MKNKWIIISVMALFFLTLGLTVQADDTKKDKEKKDDGFSGSFLMGYRGVNVDGVESKYKEDYNLDDGPRLFNLYIHYSPKNELSKYFDHLSLYVLNFGGDPFESFGVDVVKYGKYKFDFSRRKSDYFYEDHLIGHDFHNYNFTRVRDSGMLKIWLGKNVRFFMDFNRYTKKGESTTSFDISRDEYEFDKPVDEVSTETAFGVEFSIKGLSLVLEEKIHDYANSNSLFLPGFSYGENMGDSSVLSLFNINMPYDFRSYAHTVRFSARPVKNLLIKGAGRLVNHELRLDYSEETMGVTYQGSDFHNTYTGEAEFTRDMFLLDFDLTYFVSPKFAFVGAVRYHNFEQEGEMEIYDTAMPLELEFNILGTEFGLQYAVSPKATVTAGFRYESREVTEEGHEETTTRTGFFGNVNLKLTKQLRFTGDYQFGSFKDPYTPIAPTDFHRARLTAKYKGKNCWFNLTYLYKMFENDLNDGWKGEYSQLSARTGYYAKSFKFSAGYSLLYNKNEGDRNFVFYGRPSTWNILYEGRANMFDAYFRYMIESGWGIGCSANYYVNEGSWEVSRLVIRPFVEIKFSGGFLGRLSYRYVQFDEDNYGLNDYTADIIEVSFGYKW